MLQLTKLLEHSLGGNSKTLMLVMVSPLLAHVNDTIKSLAFATEVNNTQIGTAKKQIKAGTAEKQVKRVPSETQTKPGPAKKQIKP